MRLQTFNGGLNIRVANQLAAVNEAITHLNIRDEKGDIRPLNNKVAIGTVSGLYRYYFESLAVWVHSNTNRDYVEYQEKLYYTEVGGVPKVFDGTNEFNLGIFKPEIPPAVVLGAAGVLTGTYQYVYTYYNSNDGVESGPCQLSAEIVATSDQIVVSGITLPTDPQVDKIRLYRIGGNLTDFSLVVELSNITTGYTDNITDTAILGDILTTINYVQAFSGLHSLVEAYGMLFGIVGDKVYFTEIGLPWAWSEFNFIDLPTAGTGIAVTPNGLFLFTETRTIVLTGTTPETFQPFDASRSQGCVSHKSIAYNNEQVTWVSKDGLCLSTGGAIEVVTKNKLGKVTIYPKQAVVYDEVYYLIDNNNLIWVVDYRYGGEIKQYQFSDVTYLCTGNDTLLGYNIDSYYELFKGVGVYTWQYLSPVFVNGAYTERKKYKSLYMRSTGSITITIYITGTLVLTKTVTATDTHEFKIPEEYKDGYSIQIGLTGTGEVHELDWLPRGRAR